MSNYTDNLEGRNEAVADARLAADLRKLREGAEIRQRQLEQQRAAAEKRAAEIKAEHERFLRGLEEHAAREAEAAKRAMRDRYIAAGGDPADFEADWKNGLRAKFMAERMAQADREVAEATRLITHAPDRVGGDVEMEAL